jgi:hypothetical protein
MFNGLEHVWKSAEILASYDFPLKKRLCCAACEFAVALLQPEEWPPHLHNMAVAFRDRLTEHGDFDETINAMGASDVSRAAEELLALACEVRAASSEFFKQTESTHLGQQVVHAFLREAAQQNTDA